MCSRFGEYSLETENNLYIMKTLSICHSGKVASGTCSLGFRDPFVSDETVRRSSMTWLGMLMVLAMMLGSFLRSDAQSITPCTLDTNVANFGVDGDLYANYNNFPLSGIQDDWWKNDTLPGYAGPGIGVINTTAIPAQGIISALDFRALLLASSHRNYTYVQRMAVPKFTPRFTSATGGWLLLDAVAARDNNAAGGNKDSSAFTSGADKNGANPHTWSLGTQSVAQKLDLIDGGGHIRREFDLLDTTKSDLWGFAFATTRNEDGDSHVDFEIFRENVQFLGSSLTNLGPDSGHTAASHVNPAVDPANGNRVKKPGDLLVAIDYNNGGTNPIASVRVWINPNDVYGDGSGQTLAGYNASVVNATSKPYLFTGVFDSGTDASPFGYAEIRPLDTTQCVLLWSIINNIDELAPPYGTLTGSQSKFTDTQPALTLVEVGLNFSAFGLDIDPQTGPCSILFGSLMIKSRSSQSFTSEMKDFMGPYEFGDLRKTRTWPAATRA